MVYTIDDLKVNIGVVADKYDIKEILLFGSYFDHAPNEDSDNRLDSKIWCRLQRFESY